MAPARLEAIERLPYIFQFPATSFLRMVCFIGERAASLLMPPAPGKLVVLPSLIPYHFAYKLIPRAPLDHTNFSVSYIRRREGMIRGRQKRSSRALSYRCRYGASKPSSHTMNSRTRPGRLRRLA
ncbi:hypothetical protein GCM10009126_30780 [Rhodanobacter caeni]|uniref:Uncharacterized protein n=1 Tax=Rhodanobacter caeni TaxID=657654 RepID=A0ABP3EHH4_9GAMM